MNPTDSGLPVEACLGEIRAALDTAGCAVLQAPPGAGKTTLVPLRLMDEAWLNRARIVILEPRRVATRAAAARMASLLGEPVGARVGYSTRDERRVGPDTRIEVVTDGILTRRLQHDPSLPGIGLVIFDEIHERNLHSDLALALALDVRASLRPDLRLLAMSATLDTAAVAIALAAQRDRATPVIVSHGRQYPVEIRWSPSRRPAEDPTAAIEAVVRGVLSAIADDLGDVLVFLPGAAEIRRVQTRLATAFPSPGRGPVDVLPLFGAQPTAEQDRALAGAAPGRRRVILATDIAETSLTIDGVRVVVDAGLARSPRYDPNTGLTRLHTGPASHSSADQRAGRAGRQGPGVAYRLWSQHQHATRRPFPPAEIETVDLAGLVLDLAVWGAEPDDLTFLQPPPRAAVSDGRALLVALGALTEPGGRPTDEGRRMAELPLHPRLARMVTGSIPLGWGAVACALAALLEDRDILRGAPGVVEVDVAERVRLITEPAYRHPLADRAAVASARRRAKELSRRAGRRGPASAEESVRGVRPRPVTAGVVEADAQARRHGPASAGESLDLHACGSVLALAYPDRIAQARGGSRFRLRSGAGAWMAESDPLARQAFLVVAQLDPDPRDSRIRLAAALDPADLEAAAGASIATEQSVAWDEGRNDLRSTVTRSLGGLVLGTTDRKATPGPAVTVALVQQARATDLGVLSWTDAARGVQRRVLFLRRVLGHDWPDLSTPTLVATVDEWLAPLLTTAVDRRGMERIDLARVLRGLLPHARRAELDELAPTSRAVGHRTLRIDYEGEQPTMAARIQDLFGVTSHPTVAGGRVPVVLHILSPAGRPIQITADLAGFWAGSYALVRKEMAGRYPKHHWPADPSAAVRTPP